MARDDYSPAERAAWQATQMALARGRPTASATSSKEIQAEIRAAGSYQKWKEQQAAKQAPPGKGHNSKKMGRTLVADTSDSVCFDDLRYKDGVVYATFAKDGSQYDYEMSRSEAREWFSDPSLGKFFNSNVR